MLTLAVLATGVSAQTETRPITLGESRTVRSTILNEDRELQIALPETYGRTTVAYPVLFLLDGSSHLLHAQATARALASARNRIPELIVVAIPNRNRNRDMTPGPGAETFQRVLAEELIPWVERNYRAAPERILVGHSLSASFAVHTLLNRPELFDVYVAASAPVWRYDNFSTDVKAGLPRAARTGASVYLTVGEHENTRLRDGVRQFADALARAGSGEAPRWTFVDMPGEDHSSTPPRTLYGALEWRYTPYRFPFFETEDELATAGGIDGLEAHYRRAAAQLGFDAVVPEARLLQASRILMESRRFDDVQRLAATFADAYPNLAERLFAGLGSAYCDAGSAAAARDSYQRAAQAAERRAPPAAPAAVAAYRSKAAEACGTAVPSRRMPDGLEWTTRNMKAKTDASYCYGDDAANCERYGRLYRWKSAFAACSLLGDGWRLPTNEDWQRLAKVFGGVRGDAVDGGAGAYEALAPGGRSGFDVAFGGGRSPDGQYARIDAHGFYWTASESAPDRAWIYNLGTGGRILNRHADNEKTQAYAVRCVRN